MKIFFWESHHGNFGDDMNGFLWEHYFPEMVGVDDGILLVGIGTVLADELPKAPLRVVMGSGASYGRLPADLDDPSWQVYAVRGPLTARAIGRPELAAADPAILLPLLPDFPATPRSGTIFVPHWTTAEAGHWQEACELAGIGFVDPRGEAKAVIRKIASAELVIAESMHGAIVADAFRVPWIPVVTGRDTPFKWHDWAKALDLTYEPVQLVDLDSPLNVAKHALKRPEIAVRKTSEAELEQIFQAVMRRSKGPPAPPRAPVADTGLRARLRPLGVQLSAAVFDDARVAKYGAALLDKVRRLEPRLSGDAILQRKQAVLLERIERFRKDYQAERLRSTASA